MTDLVDDLSGAVGTAHVLTDRGDLTRFDWDGRGLGGEARLVVRPKTSQEVSRVVQIAHAHGRRLVPQGGRSGLSGSGLAGAEDDIVLNLERMARRPAIDVANRTAEVDAGVLLSSLNAEAETHGLMFPIDLGADPTIGGMIAANTGGARFLRYGDVRRNLLGIEVVLADGQGSIMELGRGLWKDNSTLDLKQLIASSAGAMGIVTRATVALQPLPETRVTALVALAHADAALPLLLRAERQAGTLLSAFEGMSAPAIAFARAHMPRLREPFPGQKHGYYVLVELSAAAAIQEALLRDILTDIVAPMFEDGSALDAVIDTGEDLWAVRHAIPEGIRVAGKVIGCDIAVRRGDIMRFRIEAAQMIADRWPGLVIADFGHIGDGGLHFNMVWPTGDDLPPQDLASDVQRAVFDLVCNVYGGSFSAEHGLGPRNISHYARLVPEPVRRLSGEVQRLMAPVQIGRVDFAQGVASA